MKFLVCFLAAFLVAASAFPDELLKLDDIVTNTVESIPENVEAVTITTTEESKASQSQGTVEDRTELVKALFTNYNKKVNPDHVKVEMEVSLINFNVLESKNQLESYIWLRQDWKDSRFVWDPKEHGGITVLRIDSEDVWRPDITLYNSADTVNMVNCWHSNVLVYSNGRIIWVPPCKIASICPFFSLRKQPFGEATCSLKFGSWTFDGNVLDLQLRANKTEMDLSELSKSTEFEIVKNVAERQDKHYACCTEGYPDITYNITMKRIPTDELFRRM